MGTIGETLYSVGVLIVVAKLAEGVSQRLRLNSIVAYTFTGALLGPILGVIELTPDLQVLLGIGLFLLFFLIGLDEIDVSGVIQTVRGRLLLLAVLSLGLPMGLSFLVISDRVVDLGLGLSDRAALAVTTVLSLSGLARPNDGPCRRLRQGAGGRRPSPGATWDPDFLDGPNHRIARPSARGIHPQRDW